MSNLWNGVLPEKNWNLQIQNKCFNLDGKKLSNTRLAKNFSDSFFETASFLFTVLI